MYVLYPPTNGERKQSKKVIQNCLFQEKSTTKLLSNHFPCSYGGDIEKEKQELTQRYAIINILSHKKTEVGKSPQKYPPNCPARIEQKNHPLF